MRAAVVAVALAAASCGYRPAFRDCEVVCSPTTGCPSGFVCGGEGYCRPTSGGASCGEVLDDAGAGRAEVLNVRATPNRDLDLLLVIDDSPTMAGKQAIAKAALPSLFAALAPLDDGPLNLHVGVVSSDMGTKGSAVEAPGQAIGSIGRGGCAGVGKAGNLLVGAATIGGAYLVDVAGPGGARTRNYTPPLVDAVGAMITLGEDGCGFEQHLAALRAALSGNPTNAGFLRPEASLAIVVVGDEDDCSILDPAVLGPVSAALGALQSFRCFQFGDVCDADAPTAIGGKQGCKPRASSAYIEDIAPFRTFLAGLKPEPRDVLFAALAGPPTPVAVEIRSVPTPQLAVAHSCMYTDSSGAIGSSDPGIRFDALVNSFQGRARFEPLCSADLGPAVARIAGAARQLVGGACLERAIADTSPEPGIQADCFVTDAAGPVRKVIPPCGQGSETCWELAEAPARCGALQHLELVVTRSSPPPVDARTVVRCLTP